ncbi:MAG: DNA polymerase III subunit epsilon [Alphaproteobacteria bacterium]|nr:DNA polymerase III subunit epsilon [Alphaproteobacteria bacterium]
MLREIVFDTETTGLSPELGDKVIEIGALELINHIPTGRTYHQYINPIREVPEEAVKIHGLTTDFLKNYPRFSEIAYDFLNFIGDDGVLVAHNANFDMKFINYELKHGGFDTLEKHEVVDTLEIAKSKFAGARNSLDALCRRFNIDNSKRTKHGALLDAELLSEVYLELLGGAEPSMNFQSANDSLNKTFENHSVQKIYESRHFKTTDDENKNHEEFLKNKLVNALWLSDNH